MFLHLGGERGREENIRTVCFFVSGVGGRGGGEHKDGVFLRLGGGGERGREENIRTV